MASVKYRPEIDGLRAFAVVSVVLFHAQVPGFEAGFVGVDVFFVISGYLMCALVIEEMDAGRFSLVSFFERRARRILPMLLLVTIVCIPIAFLTMMPDPLENFGQSVVASILFSNNILLNETTGYWGVTAEFKPLLHTWSLGLEEQFYLIFPPLCLLLFKVSRKHLALVLCTLTVVSLSIYFAMQSASSGSAFYLLHARGWELLAGVLLRLLERGTYRHGNDAMAGAGMGVFLGSTILFANGLIPLSLLTLAAVVGTAFVIRYAQSGTICARMLSLRAFVAIGLISYSFYLWHQPVFAFARVVSLEPLQPIFLILLMIPTLGLSFLSWRFVERTGRDPEKLPTGLFLVSTGIAVMSALFVGLVLHFTNGLPQRLGWVGSENADPFSTHVEYNQRIHNFAQPEFTDNDRPKILVLGNSRARDFSNVLIEWYGEDRLNLVYREDIYSCAASQKTDADAMNLFRQADAVFFASGWVDMSCAREDLVALQTFGSRGFVVGTKHFGYNLNPYLWTPAAARSRVTNQVPAERMKAILSMRQEFGEPTFIDIQKYLGPREGEVFIFDKDGRLLSQDREHLTQAGAKFAAERLAIERTDLVFSFQGEN